MSEAKEHITRALLEAADGDPRAAARLLPLVYDELRALARARLERTPPGHTLQPTALVHEAYIKLIERGGGGELAWNGRAHFFGAAARAMRDILVDQARLKGAARHGGAAGKVALDSSVPAEEREESPSLAVPTGDILALDVALSNLEREDPRKAEVVMLRHFAGLTNAQIALALGITERTVERDWRYAKAWLGAAIGGAGA